MKRLFLAALAGLTIFAGCKKDSDENIERIEITEGETINMLVGETVQLHVKSYPEDLNDVTKARVYIREWTSSSAEVASVDRWGEVKALTDGETVLTVKPEKYDVSASIRVVVRAIPATEIKINKNYDVLVGETVKFSALGASVLPDSASYKTLKYTSSNGEVAVIGDNGIEAVGVGESKIEVTNRDGLSAVCNFKVSHIMLNGGNLTIKKGDTFKFEIAPTTINKDYIDKWKSSDTNVATISADGTLTAKGVGHCAIVVVAKLGAELAMCNIEVVPATETEE